MNFKRIARALVCLVLVCALVVNISPIKAQAVIDPFTVGYVVKEVAVWAILTGLGISFGNIAIDKFNSFVDGFVTWVHSGTTMETDEYLRGELLRVWATGDPDCPYAVDWEIVEAMVTYLNTLDDLYVYYEGSAAPEGYAYYNGLLLPVLPSESRPSI